MTPVERGEQTPLIPEPVGAMGSLEKTARATVAAAKLEPVDSAAAQLLVDLAAVLDRAKLAPKLYVVAPLVQQYRELLDQLRMTPASRGGDTGGDDPFEKFLADLGNGGTSAEVRDGPKP